MKKTLAIFIIFFFVHIASAQEIFTDKATGREYLFLGSLSSDSKKAKVLEDGQIRWKELNSMKQTGMLGLPGFLDEIFTHSLQFELSGYEPFWHAVVTGNEIIYSDMQTGTDTTYAIRIINSRTLGYGIYFMFGTPNGEISGLVYSTGLTTPEKQQYCEADIPEEEASLFCAYLSYNNVAYQGCATIQAKTALKFQEEQETTELRTYSIENATEKDFLSAQKHYENKILYDTAAYRKKDGALELPIHDGNKPYQLFKDVLGSVENEETSVEKYYYWGQFEKAGLYIVSATFWEDVEYYLIDKITGNRTSLWEYPMMSPGGKFIANLSIPYGYEGVPNGIQLWKIKNRENDPTSTILEKYIEIDQQVWAPEELVWETDSSFILKVVPIHHYNRDGRYRKNISEYYDYLRLNLKFF